MLTRYTLRALTVDQFNRLATMVVSAEFIRRKELGLSSKSEIKNSFSIGLYLVVTLHQIMLEILLKLAITFMPIQIGKISTLSALAAKSKMEWKYQNKKWNLLHPNNNTECELSKLIEIFPVKVIDEEIYKEPPSVLIGTIDKFVQIFRKPNLVKNLFGLTNSLGPPDLIIQDELHLISGPLGSMAGAIEHIIDEYADNPKLLHPLQPFKMLLSRSWVV